VRPLRFSARGKVRAPDLENRPWPVWPAGIHGRWRSIGDGEGALFEELNGPAARKAAFTQGSCFGDKKWYRESSPTSLYRGWAALPAGNRAARRHG